MSLYVVIPAHNEAKHIKQVVQQAKEYCQNIIVVDDGSNDNTSQLAKEAGALVLKDIINLGKGAALKTGCDYAFRNGASKVIAMDADGQHHAESIPLFKKALEDNDIVFGFRTNSQVMPLVLKFGNWFINTTSRFLYKIDLKDTQCGYRAFTSKAYNKIRWQAPDYSMESEMISKVGRYKLKYTEVPIQTIYSDNYKGTTVLDGAKIVLKMFWWRLN
jgi:glycosyltransferase involved in cell wall biosynthesis